MSSDEFGRPGDAGLAAEPPGELWDEPDDAFADLSGMKMFTQEIENVEASDWDVDSDSLWGEEGVSTVADVGDGAFDSDFPG